MMVSVVSVLVSTSAFFIDELEEARHDTRQSSDYNNECQLRQKTSIFKLCSYYNRS